MDEQKKLTAEEIEETLAYFKLGLAKLGAATSACLSCGREKWKLTFSEYGPVLTISQGQEGNILGPQVSHFYVLMCDHCGHSIFYNKMRIDLAAERARKDADKEKEAKPLKTMDENKFADKSLESAALENEDGDDGAGN